MPRKQTLRLSEALAEYRTARESNVVKTTLDNDMSVLRRFVEGVGDPQVHLLTPQRSEKWFAAESRRQIESSFNKVLQRVKQFLEFCCRRGWLDRNPLSELKAKDVPEVDRLRLTAEQMLQVVETAENPRDRAMLAMSVNTGLRASDLTRLRVADLDLKEGKVRTKLRKNKSYDYMPVTADLEPEMRTWLVWYTKRLWMRGVHITPDMYLFPALGPCRSARDTEGRSLLYGDPKPFKVMSHPARIVHRALERLGIDETYQQGFHTLRRSVGRLVFELAADEGHDAALRIAQAQLGHKNSATTEIYLGLDPDKLKRDKLLQARSFLRPAAAEADNVLPLRVVKDGPRSA